MNKFVDKIEPVDKAIFLDSGKPSSMFVNDKLKGGPTKTKITFIKHSTGEIIDTAENKCVVTGGLFNAKDVWNTSLPVILPSYNSEMNLDNTLPAGSTPANEPVICLFAVGDTGCGSTPKDVYTVEYVDRIKPAPAQVSSKEDFDYTMIFPFRWVDIDHDINPDLRNYYFGKKTYDGINKIGYYFKAFDTTPQLHLRYADGTDVRETMYSDVTTQTIECFVETRLRITSLDFRDYFDDVLGWDRARISTISLCYAWYDDSIDGYKYFQDIYPYTKLNFSYKWLVEETDAIDVIYQVYY